MAIAIRFRPRARGAVSDTLRIATSPCDTILEVRLNGIRHDAVLVASVDSLDLGAVETCRLPGVGSMRFTNSGDVDIDLRDVSITGDGFAVAGVSDAFLAPSESADVGILFQGADGEHVGRLHVVAEPCGISYDIPVRVVVARASLELTGALDFGALVANVTTTRTAQIRNAGSIDISVDALSLSGAVAGLSVISPSPPFTLRAGRDTTVVLEYRSATPASFVTTLRAERLLPCVTSAEMPVRGEYGAARTISLALPDTSGWVDSRITIPVTARRAIESVESAVVRAEIRWDYSMLALDRVRTPVAGANVSVVAENTIGDERAIIVEYSGPIPEAGNLLELDMIVLVGAAETTPMRFVEASAGPDRWTVATRDGAFSALGICYIGGGRFIRIAGTFIVKAVIPNPASERLLVELESDASAHVVMTLVDALGRRVAVAFEGELPGGRRDVSLDVGAIPIGVYRLEVRSGNHVESVSLVLRR